MRFFNTEGLDQPDDHYCLPPLKPQASLPQIHPAWRDADVGLNPPRLLDAFLAYWRQHGQPLLGSAPCHEIAPHLLLMA